MSKRPKRKKISNKERGEISTGAGLRVWSCEFAWLPPHIIRQNSLTSHYNKLDFWNRYIWLSSMIHILRLFNRLANDINILVNSIIFIIFDLINYWFLSISWLLYGLTLYMGLLDWLIGIWWLCWTLQYS